MQIVGAVRSVRCVEGCGGDTASTVAIIGLVVALLGIAIALAAWKIAHESLKIAREQHQEFRKELLATADFNLTIEVEGHDDLVETDADRIRLVWRLGIKNTGTKAASDVGLNFLVPKQLGNFSWFSAGTSGILNANVVGAEQRRHDTSETLPAGSEQVAGQFIDKTLSRLGLRTHHVSKAEATVVLPKPGDERVIPVKFKVWADELPDDVDDRSIRHETIVRRTRGSA